MTRELNVRFTGSTHDGWLLGVEEAGAVIRLFTGHAIDASFPPWRQAASGVSERLVPRAADRVTMRALPDHGQWRREAV